ncbi:MAG TPA: hypothetical protein VFW52_03500 [Candidatus Saccharimonadales bacterium]|nr:hypothetical protein [Candidatus Saccharimonadales bacterium]
MSKNPLDLTAKLGKQRGIASIIVVFIITILISLVSLGFARLMDRALNDVTNNQLGAAADYAAQSGLNDAIAFVKKNPSTTVTDCKDLNDTSKAIGAALSAKTNLTTDGLTKYTCVLVDPVPGDLVYQNVPAYNSQMVKLQPESGQLTEVTINWDANDKNSRNSVNNYPNFANEQAWGSSRPVLRVTLYPMSGSPASIPGNSAYKTFYLYPNPGGGGSTFSYGDPSGSIKQGNCTSTQNSCAVTIQNLTAADYYIARLTPIYKAADITIKGKSGASNVSFRDAQSVIDVTGRSDTAVRRIQARISTEGAITVNAGNNSIPEDAIRSAGTICKRLVVPDLSSQFSQYVLVDPDSDSNSPECKFFEVTVPAPTVDLKPDSADIYEGDSVTLTWTSTNATSCSAPWTSSTGTSGSQVVTPTSDTTYTISCEGPGGPANDSTTVKVSPRPVPPTVITTQVTGFGPPSATGYGTVNPNGSNVTDCHLEWGPGGTGGTSFPNKSACSISPGSGTNPVDVYGYMDGLAPLGVYHYRVVATNAGGTSYGADKCFKMNRTDTDGGGGGGMNLCSAPPPPPSCPNGATNPPACDNNGGTGGNACPNPPSGGNGTSSPPNPCIYGLVAGYYTGSNTIHIQLSAAHCYSGASASWPGGSGGINWADGGAWAQTDVAGSGASGTVSVSCNGNGTASASTSIGAATTPPPSGGGTTPPPSGGGGCTPVPGCPPECGGTDTCLPPNTGPRLISTYTRITGGICRDSGWNGTWAVTVYVWDVWLYDGAGDYETTSGQWCNI